MPAGKWVDLSATILMLTGSPFWDQFSWVLRTVGPSRILFGSDYPVYDPAATAEAVGALGFTAEEQRLIFHDNAAKLYHL